MGRIVAFYLVMPATQPDIFLNLHYYVKTQIKGVLYDKQFNCHVL